MEQVELLLADSHLAPICADGPLMTGTTAKRPECDSPVVIPPETVAQTITNVGECEISESRPGSKKQANVVEQSKVPEQPEASERRSTSATPLDAINRTIYLRLFGGGRRRRASDSPILSMPFSHRSTERLSSGWLNKHRSHSRSPLPSRRGSNSI